MPTTLLYHDDPLLLRFDARVIAHAELAGVPAVVLDRTAFYPEAGGQMADRGTLGGTAITDVQIDDAGVVHHVLGGELPAVGSEVTGTIDAPRRRLHMALHTGQHMLSRALADVVRGETVSARLGESACTIDLDREVVDERAVAQAEELVNGVIEDDVSIRAFFPSPQELASLPLRRAPKVSESIRVVQIGDFDVSPCGGTHCTSTSQVGLLHVTGIERYKGKARISFAAGRRARTLLAGHSELLRALGDELTCGPQGLSAAIEKLRRDTTTARETLGRARGRLAESAARELLARADATGDPIVVATLDEADVDMLRAVATRVTARSDGVALLAGRTPDGLLVLAARGAGSAFDCGAFLKRAAAAAGGRGGGKPDRAEGKLPPDADWPTLVAAARV